MRTPLPKTVHVRYGLGFIKKAIGVNQMFIVEVPVSEVLTQSQNLSFQVLATILPWQEAWDHKNLFITKVMIPGLQQAYPHLANELLDPDPIGCMEHGRSRKEIAFTADLSLLFPDDVLDVTEVLDNGDWKRIFHKVGVNTLVTLDSRKRLVKGKKYRLLVARSPISEGQLDHHSGYRNCAEAWFTPEDMYAIYRGLHMIYGREDQ